MVLRDLVLKGVTKYLCQSNAVCLTQYIVKRKEKKRLNNPRTALRNITRILITVCLPVSKHISGTIIPVD
jgi:hypothetical protein